ncbi:MAG: hypothetical protein ACYDBJ_08855 [Aggregatilineales bacterium]
MRAVTVMAAAIVPYIYQDELYGVLPNDLPRLTVGGLIMRLNRLGIVDNLLSEAQRQAVSNAHVQFDHVKKEWTVAYEGKLKRELTARLRSLGQFITDCVDRRLCSDLYPGEIEKRVMVAGLQSEAQACNVLEPNVVTQITGIDNRIHLLTRPGDFLWDERLKPAYPQDAFWYLYVTVAH